MNDNLFEINAYEMMITTMTMHGKTITLDTNVIPSLNLLLVNNFLIRNDVKRPSVRLFVGLFCLSNGSVFSRQSQSLWMYEVSELV